MKTMIALLAGAAAIAIAPAAFAQHAPSVVLNGQMNFSDSQALNVVHVGAVQAATVSSLGLGNTMTAQSDGNSIEIDSGQAQYGNVIAYSRLNASGHVGAGVATAMAQGNAAQTQVCCGAATGQFVQSTEGEQIDAVAHVRAGQGSDTLVAATNAVGNNAANHATNGYVDLYGNQYNLSQVAAVSLVEGCCNNHSATSTAQAVANGFTLTGEGSTQYGAVQQINDGNVDAHAATRVRVATNPTAAAAASGNVATIDNKWGYALLDGYQENNGHVTASAEVTLDDFFGVASVGTNAIGNSALVSNVGSDAQGGMFQNNFGNVTSTATFNGASSGGGVGVVTASAIGNAQTVATCVSCGDGSVAVQGYNTQYNYGNVTATATVNSGQMGAVVASATAVGNSATFLARQQGGH